MGRLIYVNLMSLDGFIGDNEYDWSEPNPTAMESINDVMRPIGTYLYGRKTFETMEVWDRPEEVFASPSKVEMDFARIWQAADKIVFSKTPSTIEMRNTRFEQHFDFEYLRELKKTLPHDISIGGPNLAGQAIQAGLVDEFQFFIVPTVKGGGIPVMPKSRVDLELIDSPRLAKDWVFIRYRVRS